MTISRQDIEDGLRQLGLTTGDAVEVHSSLSSFGYVDGGAATVVDALMGVIGESGTIVMSAYPLSCPLPLADEDRARGVDLKLRILPPSQLVDRPCRLTNLVNLPQFTSKCSESSMPW